MKIIYSMLLGLVLASVLSAQAMAGEEVIESKGIKYRADFTVAPGNSADSDVFLLLHGTLAHNRMEIIRQMAGLLKENEFNTLAINLSFGISDRPSDFFDCAAPHKHLHYDAIDELALWTDWLKKKGVKRIIAVGHSRGGNQLSLFMDKAPAEISHFIYLAPATWSMSKARDGFGKDLDRMLGVAQKMVKDGKGKDIIKDNPFLYCENASFTAETFVSYYEDDARKNTPQVIANSSKKMLVIAGSKDTTIPDLYDMMFRYALDNENITYETVENADHFFRDLNMDDAVDLMMEFIED